MLSKHLINLQCELDYKKAQIEKLAKPKRFSEMVELGDRLIMPWERFLDGQQVLMPLGYPSDRQAGKDRPVIQTEVDLRNMRAFSRLLCETNVVCMGFRDHITNFVVGNGFKWQVMLRGQKPGPVSSGLEGEKIDPDVQACQQVLDEFCRINYWGSSGEAVVREESETSSVIANNERECYERAMEDGESLIRLYCGDDETNGIPRMRFKEPECLTCPPGEDTYNGDYTFGILNAPGDVLTRREYHFADPAYPGQLGEQVPASRVLHLKLNTKATVKRGVPDFFPVQDEARGVRTLVRNMCDVAGILAAIAYIREHLPTTTRDQVNTMIDNGSTQQDWYPQAVYPNNFQGIDRTNNITMHQAGQVIDISNGLKYGPGPMNAGVPGFVQAEQATLRMIGFRWGCPEYFSGDSSNANFASTLVSGGPFERSATSRQDLFRIFQGEMAMRVLLLAVESGRLRSEQIQKVAVHVITPPVVISDKEKDTNRRRTLFDAKVLSAQTWAQEEGYDPGIEAANIKAWNEQFPDESQAGLGLGGMGDEPTASNPLASAMGFENLRIRRGRKKEDRSGLVKKTITNKDGHKQTIWVRPGDPQPDGQQKQDDPESLPDETKQDILGRGEKIKLQVAGMLYKLDSLVPKVRAAVEAVFDNPDDLSKMWHRPMGDQSFDAVKNELGISSNMLGIVLTKVVPSAVGLAFKGYKKLRGESEAADGLDHAVDLLGEVIAAALDSFGLDGKATVNKDAIRKILTDKLGGQNDSAT